MKIGISDISIFSQKSKVFAIFMEREKEAERGGGRERDEGREGEVSVIIRIQHNRTPLVISYNS